MVKNIIAAGICLFCMNMLFNKARVNKLEQRVIEEELLTIELQAKIDGTKVTIDSLEAVLKQLEYENRIKR